MANIQWQPARYSATSFNPGASLAGASRAFQGINTTIADQREAESLAAARISATEMANRKQAYVEGAGQRKIDEEARLRAESAKRGILGREIVAGEMLNRKDAIFGDTETLAADPRYRELSGLQEGGVGPMMPENIAAVQAFEDEYAANKPSALTDPKTFRDNIFTKALESGQYDEEGATKLADAEFARVFPTISEANLKTMATAMKPTARGDRITIGGSGRAGGGSGVLKRDFGVQTPGFANEADRLATIYDMNDVPGMAERLMRGIGMDVTPSKSDVEQGYAMIAQSGKGVSPTAAHVAMAQSIGDDGNVRSDMNWKTIPGRKKLIAIAEQAQNAELAQRNNRTGRSAQDQSIMTERGVQQNYLDNLNKLFARGSVQRLSDDELMADFLSDLPDAEAAPRATAPGTPAPKLAPATGEVIEDIEQPPSPAQTTLLSDQTADFPDSQAAMLAEQEGPIMFPEDNRFTKPLSEIERTGTQKLFKGIGDTAVSTGDKILGKAKQGATAIMEDFTASARSRDKSIAANVENVLDTINRTGSTEGLTRRQLTSALRAGNLSREEKKILAQYLDLHEGK